MRIKEKNIHNKKIRKADFSLLFAFKRICFADMVLYQYEFDFTVDKVERQTELYA